jgi:hypothetical protein
LAEIFTQLTNSVVVAMLKIVPQIWSINWVKMIESQVDVLWQTVK